MKIIKYTDDRFYQLVKFLRANWAANHSIYEKALFDWQYGGPNGDVSSSRILLDDNGNMQGFLGVIQSAFTYDEIELEGAGLAIWIVNKEIKNSGAGLYLRKAVEDEFGLVYSLGVAQKILRLYVREKYIHYESIHRYVLPLDISGYRLFLTCGGCEAELTKWHSEISLSSPATPLDHINPSELAKQYASCVAPFFMLCPKKDARFWQWRYLNSVGFAYSFYSDEGGTIVFRIEDVHAPGDVTRQGLKVLRIIEIIPANGQAWNGGHSPILAETISAVVSYGRTQNCVLADFQISNTRLSNIMQTVGFKKQQNRGVTDLVQLFAPYKLVSPINIVYRLSMSKRFADISQEDTYFVKSDGDMDRPNSLL